MDDRTVSRIEHEFERGCAGKEPHETESAAYAVLGFRIRQGVTRSGDGNAPYECDFCQKWHIGHGAVQAARRRGKAAVAQLNTRHA